MKKIIFFIFHLIFINCFAKDDSTDQELKSALETWEFVKQKDGIKIYTKNYPESAVVGFRGQVYLDHPIEKVLGVLMDNEHRKEWVDRLKTSQILERKSSDEYIMYQVYGLPWPLSDRDFVYQGKLVRKGQTVYLKLKSVDHPKGPPTVGVRADMKASQYEIKIVNSFAVKNTTKTLVNM